MCTDQEAVVVADRASRTVFLAWKPSGEKIKVNPDVKYGVKRRRRNFVSGG
jgi:hypothetical protein